jgi:hypothetical protein
MEDSDRPSTWANLFWKESISSREEQALREKLWETLKDPDWWPLRQVAAYRGTFSPSELENLDTGEWFMRILLVARRDCPQRLLEKFAALPENKHNKEILDIVRGRLPPKPPAVNGYKEAD